MRLFLPVLICLSQIGSGFTSCGLTIENVAVSNITVASSISLDGELYVNGTAYNFTSGNVPSNINVDTLQVSGDSTLSVLNVLNSFTSSQLTTVGDLNSGNIVMSGDLHVAGSAQVDTDLTVVGVVTGTGMSIAQATNTADLHVSGMTTLNDSVMVGSLTLPDYIRQYASSDEQAVYNGDKTIVGQLTAQSYVVGEQSLADYIVSVSPGEQSTYDGNKTVTGSVSTPLVATEALFATGARIGDINAELIASQSYVVGEQSLADYIVSVSPGEQATFVGDKTVTGYVAASEYIVGEQSLADYIATVSPGEQSLYTGNKTVTGILAALQGVVSPAIQAGQYFVGDATLAEYIATVSPGEQSYYDGDKVVSGSISATSYNVDGQTLETYINSVAPKELPFFDGDKSVSGSMSAQSFIVDGQPLSAYVNDVAQEKDTFTGDKTVTGSMTAASYNVGSQTLDQYINDNAPAEQSNYTGDKVITGNLQVTGNVDMGSFSIGGILNKVAIYVVPEKIAFQVPIVEIGATGYYEVYAWVDRDDLTAGSTIMYSLIKQTLTSSPKIIQTVSLSGPGASADKIGITWSSTSGAIPMLGFSFYNAPNNSKTHIVHLRIREIFV